jgi:DNA mismatch repair protein MutS
MTGMGSRCLALAAGARARAPPPRPATAIAALREGGLAGQLRAQLKGTSDVERITARWLGQVPRELVACARHYKNELFACTRARGTT